MVRMLGESVRRGSDYAASAAAGFLALGFHEHWFRFTPLPRRAPTHRVTAPPTPDTDPVPHSVNAQPSSLESATSIPHRNLTVVDRLTQRIDEDLERNTGPLPKALGTPAVSHVADLELTPADLEMLA